MRELLRQAAERSIDYLESLNQRSAGPTAQAVERLWQFEEPLPTKGAHPEAVLNMLDDVGSPATVASAGARYFGFVVGGSLPAALAARWLSDAWDQNAALETASPVAAKLESVALEWLRDALSLPTATAGGFVTGATMANLAALAAARHALLERLGWDAEGQGIFGAPQITVVVSEEVHVSVLKALSILGFGRDRVVRVPVDDQGRMVSGELPTLTDRTIVCMQAGNVNTGAFDPIAETCDRAHETGAWVHVDGAFGLWVAADPERAHLLAGAERADSWATDAHKWLNVPYDCGLVFCREASYLSAAMSASAAYLMEGEKREPHKFTPELSRRARGVEVWAALKSLGKAGLSDLIQRNCRYAQELARGLREAGFPPLNEVVLNQVLVSFGDSETTGDVIRAIQEDGTCWCGGTVWQGKSAMRISVSSWATTEDDIEKSLAAIIRAAQSSAGQS